ncbi:MAG: nucleotidyltransferase domain-containing protein [Crocosphaera sp.]|nr:nucleotidyltransferase domain-containing protein [Crocosphaera sp.]
MLYNKFSQLRKSIYSLTAFLKKPIFISEQVIKSKTLLPSKLQEILSQINNYLNYLYGNELEDVILFGSQARKEAKKDSDIDILIVLKTDFNYYQEIKKISKFISNLSLETNTLISCCFTTVEQWEKENSAFYRNIRNEGIKL